MNDDFSTKRKLIIEQELAMFGRSFFDKKPEIDLKRFFKCLEQLKKEMGYELNRKTESMVKVRKSRVQVRKPLRMGRQSARKKKT